MTPALLSRVKIKGGPARLAASSRWIVANHMPIAENLTGTPRVA